MITYQSTPDFYNDYIQHFNPFHDPRNGQFTNGRGGGSGYASRSLNKKAEAKRIAQDNQDMFNDILYRNKYGKDKIEKKQAMKDFKKAVSEISKEYAVPNNIVKKYAKKGFEDRERYIEDSKKQSENSNKIVDASLKGTKELEKELASQFLSKQSGVDFDSNKINKEIDNTNIKKEEYGYGDTKFEFSILPVKKENGKYIEFHASELPDQKLKDAAKDYKKNEKQIQELSKEAILDDPYIYDNWIKDYYPNMTKQDFINKLEVKSVYCTENGAEVSVYEKNGYNLLGGHSLDMEFDLKNPKKPKWVAMNG